MGLGVRVFNIELLWGEIRRNKEGGRMWLVLLGFVVLAHVFALCLCVMAGKEVPR